jgi:hypothetical protein
VLQYSYDLTYLDLMAPDGGMVKVVITDPSFVFEDITTYISIVATVIDRRTVKMLSCINIGSQFGLLDIFPSTLSLLRLKIC